MEFLPISFLAGILTILAPCILPLLPVIIGGSLTDSDKKRPIIITLSLALSIVVFTLLLKATTAFINIPQDFWKWFSAGIVFLFAMSLLFPNLWPKFSLWFIKITGRTESIEHKSQKILFKFYNRKGFWPAVILGAALGPVFASCSPTYFLILSTVLPASFLIGVLNLFAYAFGLALVMFIVAYAGQRFTKTLNIAANPNGWFKKGLGILFLIVSLAIVGGYDKKFSTYILDNGVLDITKFEQGILDRHDTGASLFENKEFGEKVLEVKSDAFNTNILAPEIVGLKNWINSEGYTSLKELRGKVVLIDFWTYSCINCIRTLPSLQKLHENYSDKGLVILGIHAPEFAFEQKIENVQNAVNEYGLTYPIVQDNNFTTWKNYKNKYWPAKYLIDKDGQIRYYHFGEGAYAETEQAVVALLETDMVNKDTSEKIAIEKDVRTPETYLGSKRTQNFAGLNIHKLKKNQWSRSNNWEQGPESIYSQNLPATLTMNFYAAEANLVMNGNATAKIFVDNVEYKTITIDGPKLYNIFSSNTYMEHTVRIEYTDEDVEVFAWTFG